MTRYRLSSQAETDLIRIHQWGVERFGARQADEYFYQFFDRFDEIASAPHQFQSVDDVRPGYRRDDVVEIMAIIGQQELDAF